MILIPTKVKPSRKYKLKSHLCKWCGNEFTGYSWSKYCCTDCKYKAHLAQVKATDEKERKVVNNLILPMEVKDAILVLKCPVCGDSYTVVIHEPQRIVPAYCELHRNKYKRELFLKNKGGN